jgi:Anti-sigma-K factor rskA
MSEPGPQDQPDEAMVDLLIKQVTEGLSPDEQRALDVLDGGVASNHLRDFERAAAAVALAASAHAEPLPSSLAERLVRQADEHFAATSSAGGRLADLPASRASRRGGAYGWYAAAACLVLAVLAWNRSPPPAPPVVIAPTPVPTVLPPPAPPSAADRRSALLAQSESLKISLGATKDPAAAGVTGDVVWDPVTQRGFVHFVGLAPNDPARHQYQVWIFDGARDKRYPVDGGVFDVPADATEVVIEIHAALPVLSAKAFAVTVEKPGGVVVSGREHVVALGAAS